MNSCLSSVGAIDPPGEKIPFLGDVEPPTAEPPKVEPPKVEPPKVHMPQAGMPKVDTTIPDTIASCANYVSPVGIQSDAAPIFFEYPIGPLEQSQTLTIPTDVPDDTETLASPNKKRKVDDVKPMDEDELDDF